MAAFGTSFGSALAPTASNYNANKDVELSNPPSDSISSLSFSPVANYLIATSWDSQVRCYEIQANGQSAGKAAMSHDKPVLCSAWSSDGSTVFTGQLTLSLSYLGRLHLGTWAISWVLECSIHFKRLLVLQVAAIMSRRCGICRQTRTR